MAETRHERRQRERAEQVASYTTLHNARAAELEKLTKAELEARANARGLVVTRADGDGEPVRADYIRELSRAG